MKTLARNGDITILPDDKGRTTEVMNTDQYEQQMLELLDDDEVLKKDPTENKKNKLKPLLNENKISKQSYNHFVPTADIIPRIYGTPKIQEHLSVP